MKHIELFFDWQSLDRCSFSISNENQKKIEKIIIDSALQFNNICYADLGPENLLNYNIRIYFFRGFDHGRHGFAKNGECIGINCFSLNYEGNTACASFHEFSHSYDHKKGLIFPENKEDDSNMIISQIRAFEKELKFLLSTPKEMWPSEKYKEKEKESIQYFLEKYRLK